MSHSHAGHSHGASADADRGKLTIALVLILGFMVAEVVTGIVANSLALLSDAAHMLTDLYAFVGTAIAAAVILLTGFDRADAIASLLVAGLMLYSAYGLLRDSGRVFLEASPKGIDPDRIGQRMAEQPGVVEVHDLHVWEVTSQFPALSAHVTVAHDADCHRARLELADLIEHEFDIHHTTLQVEHQPERILQIE